jgi:hypothetical protein
MSRRAVVTTAAAASHIQLAGAALTGLGVSSAGYAVVFLRTCLNWKPDAK